MDSERFFYEVDREVQELEDINGDLQIAGDELRRAEIEVVYSAFIQEMTASMFAELGHGTNLAGYDQPYIPSEWDAL